MTELTKWLKVEQMAPHLVQASVAGLQTWWHNVHESTDEIVSQKQARISWNGLLDGWLSLECGNDKNQANNGQLNCSKNYGTSLEICGITAMKPYTISQMPVMI